jgi:hypothetical protein
LDLRMNIHWIILLLEVAILLVLLIRR